MPDPALFLAFAAAVTVLMLMPGPNVALIIANAVAHGPHYGLLTVAGTSSAMVFQLALTAIGVTELLATLGTWFEYIRWLGVAYLLWLGIAQWRAPAEDLTRTQPERKSPRAIYLRALFVSLTNPKTLFFYGAFFPQFLSAKAPLALQVALLSATSRHRHHRGRRLGPARRPRPGRARRQRQAPQPPLRRLPHQRRRRAGHGKNQVVSQVSHVSHLSQAHSRAEWDTVDAPAPRPTIPPQQQPGETPS